MASLILAMSLLAVPWLVGSTSSAGVYDPWYDLDDDGKIDIFDVVRVAGAYGSSGEPYAAKAAIEFDSSWVDITDLCGQFVVLEHGLGTTDVMVDITGKTTLDGGVHQRHLGGTGATPGWSTLYGGVFEDGAYSMVQTSDGGYALAGYTTSFGAGGLDVWLIKTDAAGVLQWQRTHGGIGNDEACSVVQTGDGGYVLAGGTESYGAGSYDAWLVKTYGNGTFQWGLTYGGTGFDYANCLVQTNDGGYALAGQTDSFGSGYDDFWLAKTDANGVLQWQRAHGGASQDIAYSMVQTSDGGYALAGCTYSFGTGGSDAWLVKTYGNGTFQWGLTYGGTNFDCAYTLAQTEDDGYALTGITTSFGAGLADGWLVKTDASGILQWQQEHGGPNQDTAYSMVQTSDGGYALTGSTYSFGTDGPNVWLVKPEAEYGLMWTDSTVDAIILYRCATDLDWNFVRVRIWKLHETP